MSLIVRFFFSLQVKVWFQNRRTKHKRQQNEGDENGQRDGNRPIDDDEDMVYDHEEEEELDIINSEVN